MKQSKVYKKGYLIKEGADVYNLTTEKWVKVKKDIEVRDWSNHIGHIRFGHGGSGYSFRTSYNKNQFEILY